MKGVIFDIKHFAVHDGPGIRQTIFFKGCPLQCHWCHNPESQHPDPEHYTKLYQLDNRRFSRQQTIGYTIHANELMDTIRGDQVFYNESGGGVTFSGGEPLMQPEFLVTTLQKCKEAGIHTTVDTSGYATHAVIQEVADYTDLFLYDLKLVRDDLHRRYTGVPVAPVIENLRWLDRQHQHTIIRIPVIPGITDTDKNVDDIKSITGAFEFINQINLLPYHNISNSKYERFQKINQMGDTAAMDQKALEPLVQKLQQDGMQVSINS